MNFPEFLSLCLPFSCGSLGISTRGFMWVLGPHSPAPLAETVSCRCRERSSKKVTQGVTQKNRCHCVRSLTPTCAFRGKHTLTSTHTCIQHAPSSLPLHASLSLLCLHHLLFLLQGTWKEDAHPVRLIQAFASAIP